MKPYVTFTDDAILEGAAPQQELSERQIRAASLVAALLAPIPKELKDTWVEDLGVPPISWEADEPDATVEEPTDELATPTATVGEPAEEPDTPPMQWEVGERRKVPGSNYPSWMEAIHPTQPATPAGWTLPTLGKLRQCHCSWSLRRRKAWHWWAEECKMATEGESDSMSLWGSPMANPGVAPPPGFREVVACLLRDSPSLAPVEAPLETRLPNVMMGSIVAALSATWIVQDEATRVTYVDTVTTLVGRVALRNPHMMANLPGPLWRTSLTPTR